ncbi:chaplin [Streptomyces sp. 8N616]|uniref:chaplin n=1 Tax=Streptomyces sp. 8N616 TaxID=3457414 RepID=UPI003FD55325
MSRIVRAAAVTAVASAMVTGAAGTAVAGTDAKGAAVNSGGVIAGNVVQIPIHVPINFCGNNVSWPGGASFLSPTIGNTCVNAEGKFDKDKYDRKRHKDNGHGHGLKDDGKNGKNGKKYGY